MRAAQLTNAVLALGTEMALLVACVAIGLHLPAGAPLRIVAAVLLPLLVTAVWAMTLAPRAARRLRPPGRLVAQVLLFGLAVVGLAASGLIGAAIALAVPVVARLGIGVRIGAV